MAEKLKTVAEVAQLVSATVNESLSVSESGKPDTVFADFSKDVEPILREWAEAIISACDAYGRSKPLWATAVRERLGLDR